MGTTVTARHLCEVILCFRPAAAATPLSRRAIRGNGDEMGPRLSKQDARWVTGAILVVANLMPLAGALLLRWETGEVLFVYWLESTVVGFFNVVKMAQAEGSGREVDKVDLGRLAKVRLSTQARSTASGENFAGYQKVAEAKLVEQQHGLTAPPEFEQHAAPTISLLAKVPLILFFLVHYGLFMAGYAIFLIEFFGLPTLPVGQMLLTTLLLFTSHGISYLIYFLGREEYRMVSPGVQMARPYGRIFLMHFMILIGGILIQAFLALQLLLALLVALKILFDLVAHFRSHARYESAAVPAA